MRNANRAGETPHEALQALLHAVRAGGIDSRGTDAAFYAGLHDLGARASASGNVADLFDYLVEITLSVTGGDAATVHLSDPQGRGLVLAADRLRGEPMERLRDPNDDSQELLRAAFERGEPIGMADIKRSTRGGVSGRQALLDLQLRAAQWMPVVATSGTVLGAIGVYFRTARGLTDRQSALMVRFARHAADFAEYARARRELQRHWSEERDAHQRADEKVRQRDQFLATLSHELRQPLSAALSALDLSRRRLTHERQERVSALMERQLHQLVRLVDDLIDLSHVERGTLVLERRRLDVRTLLDDAVDMTAPLFHARRQSCELDLGDAAFWVFADVARLTQVFSNLLQNAASYTPLDGTVRITAGAGTDRVLVRIRDTGVGMDPATLARIFDPFERGESMGGRASFGIGLTVVRQIVQLHGGSVHAASGGLGCGSEFIVALPLLSDVVDQRAEPD